MAKYQGTPQQGLLAATLGFFIGFAAVSLFGPTAERFKDVMQLSPVMVGFLVAVPSLSGSLLRIPFAAWVDTSGGRKPFLVLLAISILGMLGLTGVVVALYPDQLSASLYPLLLVLGVLCGCGIATFSVGIGQVSYWFPKAKQGSALGTYAGIGNIAPGLFSLLIPIALSSLGLAWSYLIWLIVLVAGSALYYFLGRNAPYFQLIAQGEPPEQAIAQARQAGEEIFPTGSLKDSLLISAKIWKTWVLVAIYFTTFGGFIALTSWLPTYWKSFFGVSVVAAGALTATFSILTSLSRVMGGKISDRMGGEKTAMISISILIVGAILMSLAHNMALALLAEIVMGLGMGISNAAVFKMVPQEVPQAVGGASGWVGGLGAFGGFVIPPILGAIVRSQGQTGYATGFIVLFGLALLSLGLAFLLRQTHPKTVSQAIG